MDSTLSEQCIQGEGLVQVNLELKSVNNIDRINILDVLKPPSDEEPVVEETAAITTDSAENSPCNTTTESLPKAVPSALPAQENKLDASKFLSTSNGCQVTQETISPLATAVGTVLPAVPFKGSVGSTSTISKNLEKPSVHAASESITRWVMDSGFRRDQERLKIPLGNWMFQPLPNAMHSSLTYSPLQILPCGLKSMSNTG